MLEKIQFVVFLSHVAVHPVLALQVVLVKRVRDVGDPRCRLIHELVRSLQASRMHCGFDCSQVVVLFLDLLLDLLDLRALGTEIDLRFHILE